ncbi:MAG: hypothetical protein PWP56_2734 [Acetobacterium sp.]|nr:hypothetical protein [Acetobacterium sp.]
MNVVLVLSGLIALLLLFFWFLFYLRAKHCGFGQEAV